VVASDKWWDDKLGSNKVQLRSRVGCLHIILFIMY
jgi:hypothetical protein